MTIPFDFEKFSSEIITGVVVFLMTQAPKAWRWTKDRIRPDTAFPSLLSNIGRGRLQVSSSTEGDVQLWVQFTNLSGSDIVIEQSQVAYLEFDRTVMPQADSKVVPLRIVVPRRSVAQATISIRLHGPDIARIAGVAFRAPNVFSSPGHQVRVELSAVVRRRFFKANLAPRYLEAQVEVTLPDSIVVK